MSTSRGLRLLDLAAMVVGYGMAALLVRALWPSSAMTTTSSPRLIFRMALSPFQ
jgi:hypothetical protein